MEKILSWEKVIATHGMISGISTKDGFVKSLLCSSRQNQKYPNQIKENGILYFIGPNTFPPGIKALYNSLKKKNSFPVFEKLGVNKWQNLGNFKVESVGEKKDTYTSFNLVKN